MGSPSVLDRELTNIARTTEKAERLLSERDLAIVRAFAQGASLRRIAEAAGMTHVGVKKLVDRLQPDLVIRDADGNVMSVAEVKSATAIDPVRAEELRQMWADKRLTVLYTFEFDPEESVD